jgi:hypothetical protein
MERLRTNCGVRGRLERINTVGKLYQRAPCETSFIEIVRLAEKSPGSVLSIGRFLVLTFIKNGYQKRA